MTRPWKPLSAKRLREILLDTEKDNPNKDHCDAEVYQMAAELTELRQRGPQSRERPKVSAKQAAKIALYLKYIAHVLENGP